MTFKRWGLLIFLIVAGLFAVNYFFGWLQAYQLAGTYFRDAEAAYAQEDYLNALTGYKEFDRDQNKYVQRGGYLQVERIWAIPTPGHGRRYMGAPWNVFKRSSTSA